MILPAVNFNERPAAQADAATAIPLSQGKKSAMVLKSATVPSCFYPADDDKTCYPSPIRRSAGPSARPPFFAEISARETLTSPQAEMGVDGSSGTSTGDAKQCAPNLHSQFFSRPQWPYPGASHPILSAQARAPLLVASARPFLAARSRQALSWGLPQARYVTTLTSAETHRAGLIRVTRSNSNHRSLCGIGGFFVRASKTRTEGTTTCLRSS